MNPLLNDALRFLQENFEADTSWSIPPSQAHLKRAKKIKEEIKASIPLQRPAPMPQEEEKKEAPPQPLFSTEKKPEEEEPIKPAPKNPALGVDVLSDAVKKLFPQFSTHKEVPEENKIKVDPIYKKALQAEVVLFSFREGKESDLFLQNICLAISAHFVPAAVFDAKKWEMAGNSFDLFFKESSAKIFISSKTLYEKPSLLPFIKEIPSSRETFLHDVKLVILHPFETYFNQPLEKKELWKTVCSSLKKHFPSQASS